jgi:hypothetical protein
MGDKPIFDLKIEEDEKDISKTSSQSFIFFCFAFSSFDGTLPRHKPQTTTTTTTSHIASHPNLLSEAWI